MVSQTVSQTNHRTITHYDRFALRSLLTSLMCSPYSATNCADVKHRTVTDGFISTPAFFLLSTTTPASIK